MGFEDIFKAGYRSADRRLDRIDEKDPRSRNYPVSDLIGERRYQRLRSYTWRCGPTLHQGWEGACVGFAWAHELAARPAEVEGLDARFARENIYYEAQKRDRYPGGAYPNALPFMEGTSVLGGAKAVSALGYISEYRWAFDFQDLVASVGYRGPAVFGCRWTVAMNRPDADGFVGPSGRLMGGHCIMLNSVRIKRSPEGKVDLDNSYFQFQNSWGPEWGIGGFGKLRFSAILEIWDGAETCIPVTRRKNI